MDTDQPFYVVNVEGAIANGNEYLVATRAENEEHAAGMISLVGGKVESAVENDTVDVLKETVRREIREETTLEVADEMAYVGSGFFLTDEDVPVVNILFLCQYDSGTAVPAEPEEIASVQWLTADEVTDCSGVPPWTQRSITKAEERRVELGW